jgi:hypothetical protein
MFLGLFAVAPLAFCGRLWTVERLRIWRRHQREDERLSLEPLVPLGLQLKESQMTLVSLMSHSDRMSCAWTKTLTQLSLELAW